MKTSEKQYPLIAAHPLGVAFGITTGVVYVVCAFFVLLWRDASVRFFNVWVHGLDLTKIAGGSVTVTSFLMGLITIMIASYLIGLLFGWSYNKCVDHCGRKGWI